MRAVLQRAKCAEVRVGDEVVGRIGPGLVVLLGVGKHDTGQTADALVEKLVHLRIFNDAAGKMNRSLLETGRFRATMDVELVNDGPVTLLLDSERQF